MSRASRRVDPDDIRARVVSHLREGARVIDETADALGSEILLFAFAVAETLLAGGKIFLCGNGGSAADAQHIAAELVGRFKLERGAWPAVALTTDTSVLTAVANDYAFAEIFARQVEALGREGDMLIAISTSGSSPNVVNAAVAARARRVYVVGLTGDRDSPLSAVADLCLRVPSRNTPHVQQTHLTILHAVCDYVDQELGDRHS